MTVWGADAVADASGELHVRPGDVVTPLARERAAELGVRIVVEQTATRAASQSPPTSVPARRPSGPGVPPTSVPPPARESRPALPSRLPSGPPQQEQPSRDQSPPTPLLPPSPALFRRGAPVHPATRGSAQTRVIVVGAGHVGMITASRLADADAVDEVVLVDVIEGLAEGIALDITHTAALGGYTTRVRGTTTIEEAGSADYVVITAGRARQPGMSRSDLVSTNAEIVGDVARRVAVSSPRAVLVVVTNPLDEMTQHAWTASGFPPERVLGMAGVLDTARFQALVGLTGVDRADRIEAIALGSHGAEMVIPLSQATVGGQPLTQLLDAVTLDAIVSRTRGSGAEVVGLLKQGSAFLAPGTSAAHMVLAMLRESGDVLPAAVLADGSYGIRDVYIGLPARLGRGGVREIVELPLTTDELEALREAAARIRERLGALTSA